MSYFKNVFITDATSGSSAPIVALPFTSGSALRVAIGPTDPVSDVPVVMDYGQHQIHEGEAYRAQDPQTSLGTGTVKYGLTVPTYANTIQAPHAVIGADVYNGTVRIDLYEGATFTSGSSVTAYNKNRNSANAPGMTVKTGVTSTNGTLIYSEYVGSGSRSAGTSQAADEFILKSNTIYRVDLIGQVAGTAAIWHAEWYEDLGV